MRRLSLIIALFLTLALSAEARNYVVCIGLADYPGTQSDLKLSSQDAVTMKTLYEKNGDAVTDILMNERATVENAKVAIANMFAKATADDAIILFFSGHGVPGGFVCYNGLLRYKDIVSVMKQSDAKNKIVFADACYSGKARSGKARNEEVSDTNVMFFLSSRTNEISQEIRKDWKNSLFTAYVERGLRGGADVDHNRTITARELFDFVSKGVAKSSWRKQHPVMWGKFDNDMPLMKWKEVKK